MPEQNSQKKTKSHKKAEGITEIFVSGFKSINKEQSIEIAPLTILAGANSSGKSSIMQPILLLKQTLEATYDPGALLLNGPNVKFTSAEQLFSRIERGKQVNEFQVGIKVGKDSILTICFMKEPGKALEIHKMSDTSKDGKTTFRLGMKHEEIMAALPPRFRGLPKMFQGHSKAKPVWTVVRNRCFLEVELVKSENEKTISTEITLSPTTALSNNIRNLIHLPGLRGNPERTYPVTALSTAFPGTFENYAASVISQWQADRNNEILGRLSKDLESLGLTWKVSAKPISDTQVELEVGRLAHITKKGARDLVNIADVGFGVSQSLPVLVALHVAKPGQMLYLEQPEIHLHPRAQIAMAKLLADAADRGVRVIAETHSSLILLGIQTLVAEGKLSLEKVKLHWFKRCEDGTTEVKSADLNENGAFGDWPSDFGEVALEAESRYLDATESRRKKI